MKFLFSGVDEVIEINFDFSESLFIQELIKEHKISSDDIVEIPLKHSKKDEFIKSDHPIEINIEVSIFHLHIPEHQLPKRFYKYQINLFKELLEKITNGEEFTVDDKYIFNSSVIKPIISYFEFKKELFEKFELPSYEIKYNFKPAYHKFSR